MIETMREGRPGSLVDEGGGGAAGRTGATPSGFPPQNLHVASETGIVSEQTAQRRVGAAVGTDGLSPGKG